MLKTFRLLDNEDNDPTYGTIRYVAFQESDIDEIIFYMNPDPPKDMSKYSLLYQITLKNGKTYRCVSAGSVEDILNKSLVSQIADEVVHRIKK